MQIDMTNIFIQLGVLFFIMVLGYFLKYSKRIDGTFDRALSKLLLEATVPSLILSSVLNAENIPPAEQVLKLFGLSFAVYAILIVIGETRVAPAVRFAQRLWPTRVVAATENPKAGR